MSFAAALEKETFKPPKRCAAVRAVDDMPAEYGEQYFAAVNDGSASAAAIARVLQADGYRLSPSSVSNHRRGECACDVR